MSDKKMHLHSMIVHAVMALAPLAAVAHLLGAADVRVCGFGRADWRFITGFSVAAMLAVSLPATLTGLFEIRKMYGKWHSTHHRKLLFSAVLMFALLFELGRLCGCPLGAGLESVAIVLVNPLCAWFLSYYGIKISLGRQSAEPVSYVPDFFNPAGQADILEKVAAQREKTKMIDIYGSEE